MSYLDKGLDWIVKNPGIVVGSAVGWMIRQITGAPYDTNIAEAGSVARTLIQSAIDSGAALSAMERLMAAAYLQYDGNIPQYIVDSNGNLRELSTFNGTEN